MVCTIESRKDFFSETLLKENGLMCTKVGGRWEKNGGNRILNRQPCGGKHPTFSKPYQFLAAIFTKRIRKKLNINLD
jgi:hypothetical protein